MTGGVQEQMEVFYLERFSLEFNPKVRLNADRLQAIRQRFSANNKGQVATEENMNTSEGIHNVSGRISRTS